MKVLFILNGAPYGDERTYNGLRLAGALAKREQNEVRVFEGRPGFVKNAPEKLLNG